MNAYLDTAGLVTSTGSDGMVGITWTPEPSYTWKPQPDITTYELALCLGPLLTRSGYGVAALPNEAQRHFELVR